MPTKLCYFGLPMHRFPKPGYYNEARFNITLDSKNSETASSTEETLPKASTSKEAYQIGKQSKPQKQREQYLISIQVVHKSGYSDIILVRHTVLECGKLLLSAKAIEFELDGGFYEALDLRTAETLRIPVLLELL
ncbi:unnamed protein product [Parnassius apollo]|uniref:(apollo) hypothetical protein n=1 Tax=Parnassius apollo TaxID=110799 RepID=A0A8S3XKL6_PARAO|nr:unnamed protein product [Parnassius apollo]